MDPRRGGTPSATGSSNHSLLVSRLHFRVPVPALVPRLQIVHCVDFACFLFTLRNAQPEKAKQDLTKTVKTPRPSPPAECKLQLPKADRMSASSRQAVSPA